MIDLNYLSQLMIDGKTNDAIKMIEEELSKNPQDIVATFYHAFISFAYLKDESDEVIAEFEKVISKKGKLKGRALALLAIIYSHRFQYEKCIDVSQNAECDPGEFTLDFNFSVALAYYNLNNPIKSLEYVDKCIEEEPNEEIDFYSFKAEVLINIEEYPEAEETLEIIYSKFGASFIYYYINSKLLLGKYYETKEESYLDQVISEINRAEQYNNDELSVKIMLVEVYALKKEVNQALSILEAIKDKLPSEDYQIARIKVYQINGLKEKIKEEGEQFLQKEESWRIYSVMANALYSDYTCVDDVRAEQELYLKSYSLNKSLQLFRLIFKGAYIINNFDMMLDLAYKYKEEHPDDKVINYYIARCKSKLNYSYDELIKAYMEPGVSNQYFRFDYLNIMASISDQPKFVDMLLKKEKKIRLEDFPLWNRKTIGTFYLFGLHGFPKDYSKAKLWIESTYKECSEDPCAIAVMGRYYEVVGEESKAFELYKRAYERSLEVFPLSCNCSQAYYAHALLRGIGTNINVEQSKKIILHAIQNFKCQVNNTTIYLYTYFALNNDARFSLSTAKEMLEQTNPFSRYEITRAMMLKCVMKKLGLETGSINTLIKLCVKYGSKNAKQFYKENQNKDIVYICSEDL